MWHVNRRTLCQRCVYTYLELLEDCIRQAASCILHPVQAQLALLAKQAYAPLPVSDQGVPDEQQGVLEPRHVALAVVGNLPHVCVVDMVLLDLVEVSLLVTRRE